MRARAILAGATLLIGAAAQAGVTVSDGDTIRLGAERIRIVGLDTPELNARCPAERELAVEARGFLRGLLAAGAVGIERRGADRHGRTLAVVTVNGRDVAALLIAAGLARPYDGGRRAGWC
jgi:micrococcal nuclease